MQKLIKLSDTHYIVVDDSEIKIGSIVLEKLTTGSYDFFTIHTQNDIDVNNQLNVTHSTQQLEEKGCTPEGQIKRYVSCKGCDKKQLGIAKIKLLSISEAEEAIYGYSVEKIFNKETTTISWSERGSYEAQKWFEKGFNTYKELVKDKLFTIEDLRLAFEAGNEGSGGNLRNRVRKYNGFDEYITNGLGYIWCEDNGYVAPEENEWEVEFDEQNKLKLI